MELKDISNILYYWKNRHNPECSNSLSVIVWWCLLSISLLLLLLAVLYSIWMLSGSSSVRDDGPVVGQGETLSREALANTLDLFEQRKQRYQFVQSNPPRIEDPSE